MAERQQREKQQISIPYLWEDKPGLPKKAWTYQGEAAATSSPSPARLVVSVPFQWEEKPGTPLRTTPAIPNMLLSTDINPILALPELYWNPFGEIAPLNPFIGEEDTAASDLEAFSFEMNVRTVGAAKTDESFAVFPDSWESFSESGSYWNENWQSASETEGHGGSSSSRSSSAAEEEIKDTSVIEFLFPLASPGSSFPRNSVNDEQAPPAPMAAREDTATARRMLTLEELILLSRKLSCRRKQQISLKNTNHKKEDLKKSVLSCFPFIYNNKRLKMITT